MPVNKVSLYKFQKMCKNIIVSYHVFLYSIYAYATHVNRMIANLCRQLKELAVYAAYCKSYLCYITKCVRMFHLQYEIRKL